MTTANRRFTLGISVEHFDFRVDVHRFIEALSAQADVVVFTDRPFAQPIRGLKEVRLYRHRRSLMASLVSRLFLLARRLPKSRNNFFITEFFKIAGLPKAQKQRAELYLKIRRILPFGLSVDAVLPWLRGGDATEMGDIDAFLHITQIGDLPFVSRALASGKPNAAYIYSWDHPCKHTTIPRHGMKAYFTWNSRLSEDMVELQGLRMEQMQVVGATQLAPLKQYLETPAARQRLVPFDYVYFGCGPAQDDLSRQEIMVAQKLAQALRSVAPELVLLVRPHPNHANWDGYEALKREPNVQLDWFRQEGQGRMLSPAQVFEKFNKVEHARAFVHLGTTLGWEACYFNHPVLFLAFKDMDMGVPRGSILHLDNFIHQYHCDRYLILDGYPNVVRQTAALAPALAKALSEPSTMLAYNRKVADETPLRSLEAIADDMLRFLKQLPAGQAK